MKSATRCTRSIAAVVFAMASFTAIAGPLNLNGIGFVQYGDAQSYSLPIASIQSGTSGPGSPYYVDSTPGAIQNLVVVATGASGTGVVTNFAGMDNAYATPNGAGGAPYFAPSAATYQGTTGVVNNNGATTWDSSLAAMKTFLNGDALTFFLNNNQVNSGGSSLQSLAAWAQIRVKDAAGNSVGIFDLTNRGTTAGAPGAYNLVSQGGGGTFLGNVGNYTSNGSGPVAGTDASTDYVLSGGSVCVTTNTPVPVPVPCDPSNPNISAPINHNLGANQAAYALVFPELNALLNNLFATLSPTDLALYTLSVDVRLGCDPSFTPAQVTSICQASPYGRSLNNGYEQIFIGTSLQPGVTLVPEPEGTALLAIGIIGLALVRRRRV